MVLKYKDKTLTGENGGITYTSGEGITIEDNTINVTTPVQGIYTQSEFDALPDEQRNNGLYVVEDGNGGESSGGEVYSTEEVRIGTWIDGKPLYRIVWELKMPRINASTYLNVPKVETLIRNTVMISISGLTGSVLANGIQQGISCPCNYQTSYQRFIITTNVENAASRPAIVIIEYTKTTD